MVRVRGKSGAAIKIASRNTIARPKGTMRVPLNTSKLLARSASD